jgi:hypothetical protein
MLIGSKPDMQIGQAMPDLTDFFTSREAARKMG